MRLFLVSLTLLEGLVFLRTASVLLGVGFLAWVGWLFFADVDLSPSKGPAVGAFNFLVVVEPESSAARAVISEFW